VFFAPLEGQAELGVPDGVQARHLGSHPWVCDGHQVGLEVVGRDHHADALAAREDDALLYLRVHDRVARVAVTQQRGAGLLRGLDAARTALHVGGWAARHSRADTQVALEHL
jgi:hypothetical protein